MDRRTWVCLHMDKDGRLRKKLIVYFQLDANILWCTTPNSYHKSWSWYQHVYWYRWCGFLINAWWHWWHWLMTLHWYHSHSNSLRWYTQVFSMRYLSLNIQQSTVFLLINDIIISAAVYGLTDTIEVMEFKQFEWRAARSSVSSANLSEASFVVSWMALKV